MIINHFDKQAGLICPVVLYTFQMAGCRFLVGQRYANVSENEPRLL